MELQAVESKFQDFFYRFRHQSIAPEWLPRSSSLIPHGYDGYRYSSENAFMLMLTFYNI